ncbi:winged helix-turn-helix domain-containing protein [Methanococcus maripaludis]|uniref:DNA-binding HxlR family transcriptional regulator n=1 Tax=Methanococcus maripaludis TaxID=39152 RepID=A0A7J9PE69_METMI|nr:winged helix-turn-helix domain-containing protein [Methanococcus maripaludis]MBA2860960.1 DNA-binding HxlR family transcriptional regulator [Methanococcus maripaludis]
MVLKAISRKNADVVLYALKDNELYFNQLQKETNLNPSTLNTILNDLISADLVERRKEGKDIALPKTYYRITLYGLKALGFYELNMEIENMKKRNAGSRNSINVENNHGTVINEVKTDSLVINNNPKDNSKKK